MGWGTAFVLSWMVMLLIVSLVVIFPIFSVYAYVQYSVVSRWWTVLRYIILLVVLRSFFRLIHPIQFRSMPWEVNDLTFDVIQTCATETVETFFRILGEKYEDTLVIKEGR